MSKTGPNFVPYVVLESSGLMNATEAFQRACRRFALIPKPASVMRKWSLQCRGAKIGSGTVIPRRLQCTWPHQIRFGRNCILQSDLFFNYDHYWTPGPSMIFGDRVFVGRGCEFNIKCRLEIGNDCLIASGCTFVDSNHGTDPNSPMNQQPANCSPIILEENVWIGAHTIVLKGVRLGKGSVVGAGSVLTKSIPAGEIWAGVPAKRLTKYISVRSDFSGVSE